jgi:uncharacterized protein YbjT (DUF2867 family)
MASVKVLVTGATGDTGGYAIGRLLELADKYGVSAGRISQKRRWFAEDWARFCGEAGEV